MADCEPILPYIKPGWIGVEIGVSQGHSAKALLDHGVRFLYLIDPWADYEGLLDKYTPGAYEEAMERLSPYAGKHAHLRMTSAEASQYVPGNLDFVWIDGNHRYEWVKSDLELYWPKIKTGGVMCGHDYTNNEDTCQVKRAVDEFCPTGRMRMADNVPVSDSSCWVIQK
jgi:hypothetical protein